MRKPQTANNRHIFRYGNLIELSPHKNGRPLWPVVHAKNEGLIFHWVEVTLHNKSPDNETQQIRNPKHEILNRSKIQISNVQNVESSIINWLVSFGHLNLENLEIVSNFDIGI